MEQQTINPDDVVSVAPADSTATAAKNWFEQNAPPSKQRLHQDAKPITDAQRQYAPPGAPPLPVPDALKKDFLDTEQEKSVAAKRAILESPVAGGKQAISGVKQVAGAKSAREAAGGVHNIIAGGFEAATPLMLESGAAAPLKTARTLASALVSQTAVENGLEWLGLPKEYAQVAGDFAGIIAGAKAHGKTPEAKAQAREQIKAQVEPVLKQQMEASNEALLQVLKVETDPAKRAQLESQAKARGLQVPEQSTWRKDAAETLGETARVDSQFDEAERRLEEKKRSSAPAKERKKAAKPVVPETGVPEEVARTQAARQAIIGKPPEQWQNSDIIAADELITQGYTGAGGGTKPEVPAKAPEAKTPERSPEETDALRQKIIGKPKFQWTPDEVATADQLIAEGQVGDTRPAPKPPAPAAPKPEPETPLGLTPGEGGSEGPVPEVKVKTAEAPQKPLELKETPGETPVKPAEAAPEAPPAAPQAAPAPNVATEGTEAPQGAILGFTGQADVPHGYDVDFTYAVVPEESLVASHNDVLDPNQNFPQELQPRKRNRVASKVQVKKLYDTLKPRKLGHNDSATTGAPVVGPDGVVESGNGRMVALRRLFKDKHANGKAYVDWLKGNAQSFGIDPAKLEGVKNPVLVRVRKSLPEGISRKEFTRHANERETGGMSAVEMAAQDSEFMDSDLISKFVAGDSGDINSAANRSFVRDYMANLGDADRETLMKADGTLNSDGIKRIRNGIFARAYGDVSTLETMAESTDSNIKSITNGMLEAAPDFVKLDAAIESGTRYPVSISEQVGEASAKFAELKRKGESIEDYVNQVNLDGTEVPPLQRDLLRMFDEFSRSGKKIGEVLRGYAQAVDAIGDPNQIGMFGAAEKPEPEDVLNAVIEGIKQEAALKKAAMEKAKAGNGKASEVQQSGSEEKPEDPGGAPKAPEGNAEAGGLSGGAGGEEKPQVAQMRNQKGEAPLARGGLFDSEESKDVADSSAKDREKLLGERLTAGFKSAITPQENQSKLKPGKKPVQRGFFSEIEDEKQDTLFLKPLEDNEIPMTDTGNIDVQKVLTDHKFKYVSPKSKGQPGRLYMDKPTSLILNSFMGKLSGDLSFNAKAMAIPGEIVLSLVHEIRNTVKLGGREVSGAERGKLLDLGVALYKSFYDNPTGTVAIQAGKGQDIRSVRAQLRHEMSHIEQMGVIAKAKHSIWRDKAYIDREVMSNPVVKKAIGALKKMGYQDDPRTMAGELLSFAAGGEVKDGLVTGLDLTLEETAQMVGAMVDSIKRVDPNNVERLLRYAKRSFKSEVEKASGGSERKPPPVTGNRNKVGSGG